MLNDTIPRSAFGSDYRFPAPDGKLATVLVTAVPVIASVTTTSKPSPASFFQRAARKAMEYCPSFPERSSSGVHNQPSAVPVPIRTAPLVTILPLVSSTVRAGYSFSPAVQPASVNSTGKLIAVCPASIVPCSVLRLPKPNLNSATQVVLSGAKDGVAAAATEAAEMKLRAIVLQVAGAFHSPFMASAREKLGAVLDGISFSAPKMPVLANAHPESTSAI